MTASNGSLNSYDWPFEASYRALSYAFRIRSTSPRIGELIDRSLGQFRHRGAEKLPTFSIVERNGSGYDLFFGRRTVGAAAPETFVVDQVLWEVNGRAIARVNGKLALHAGAVSFAGNAVLLPAPPDFGKTTLTGGLVRAGFHYLSDEVALIDLVKALVHPYPRALWMDRSSVEAILGTEDPILRSTEGPHWHLQPGDLRPGPIGEPCPVRYVVSPRYEKGAETTLSPMSRAEAVALFVDQSFNFARFGARGLKLLGRVVEGAECFRLRIGDLPSAVETVLDVVAK
jgi:hypothetical protein